MAWFDFLIWFDALSKQVPAAFARVRVLVSRSRIFGL